MNPQLVNIEKINPDKATVMDTFIMILSESRKITLSTTAICDILNDEFFMNINNKTTMRVPIQIEMNVI